MRICGLVVSGQIAGVSRPATSIDCIIDEAIHCDEGAPSRGAGQGVVARGRVVEEVEDGIGPLAAHRQGPGGIRPRQGRPQNEDKGMAPHGGSVHPRGQVCHCQCPFKVRP